VNNATILGPPRKPDFLQTMSLAIFDLDNTLLSGDSDYEWGQYLVHNGHVDGEEYERANERYYREYQTGKLDIFEFLNFALRPLATNDMATLISWRKEFMQKRILPIISQGARALVNEHRQLGDTLLIITATNRFITEPIAREFGIDNLLATDPELVDGRFTGKVVGVPCFQHGKVIRLQEWLQRTGHELHGSCFYSDSHNDLPLMRLVERPIAVNPDQELEAEAVKAGWKVMGPL
jgi:HAD superfamily hydrolase (TIGR01490 family)